MGGWERRKSSSKTNSNCTKQRPDNLSSVGLPLLGSPSLTQACCPNIKGIEYPPRFRSVAVKRGKGRGRTPLPLSLNAKFPLDYRPGGRGQKKAHTRDIHPHTGTFERLTPRVAHTQNGRQEALSRKGPWNAWTLNVYPVSKTIPQQALS